MRSMLVSGGFCVIAEGCHCEEDATSRVHGFGKCVRILHRRRMRCWKLLFALIWSIFWFSFIRNAYIPSAASVGKRFASNVSKITCMPRASAFPHGCVTIASEGIAAKCHLAYQLTWDHLLRLLTYIVSVQGINCSCFAYGHTGSGKTYCMFGDNRSILPDDPIDLAAAPEGEGFGLVPRVCYQLLNRLKEGIFNT